MVIPVKPSEHKHWYELTKSWQLPPCWHGADTHSSTLREQLSPATATNVSKPRFWENDVKRVGACLLACESRLTVTDESSCFFIGKIGRGEFRECPVILHIWALEAFAVIFTGVLRTLIFVHLAVLALVTWKHGHSLTQPRWLPVWKASLYLHVKVCIVGKKRTVSHNHPIYWLLLELYGIACVSVCELAASKGTMMCCPDETHSCKVK